MEQVKDSTELQIFGYDTEVALRRGAEAVGWLVKFIGDRPNKLVIKGKQYLEFQDWQFLGLHFGITARVDSYEEINITQDDRIKLIGFKVQASAIRNGQVLSTAFGECNRLEPQWKDKPRFQILSMAQIRACRNVLKNVLRWVFDCGEVGNIEVEVAPDEVDQKEMF